MKQYDVIVIGGGPAGMYTAFYCGLRQLNTLLVESLEQLGGQLAALYPEKYVYDLPGFPKVKAIDFVNGLQEQLNQVQEYVTIALDQNIQSLEKRDEHDFVVQSEKDTFYSKAIIVTAGGGSFIPQTMRIEGEADYKNIQYFVRDLEQYRDRRVVIFGGGDSAVDWALMLEPIAKSVSIVHRRKDFRAKEHSVQQLKDSTVEIYIPFSPVGLNGQGDLAQEVVLRNNSTKEEITVSMDDIIVNFGFSSSLGPIADWGLELTGKVIPVDTTQATSIPGIFACGDICTYPGRINQVTLGLGEGLVASASVKHYIDPDAIIGAIR